MAKYLSMTEPIEIEIAASSEELVADAESQETQAAGRVLSQRNADRLSGSVRTLLEVLGDAGILDTGDMNSLADFLRKEANASPALEVAEVEAGAFKEMCDRNTWQMRLNSAVNLFQDRFCMLHEMGDDEMARFLPPGSSRSAEIAALMEDFNSVLSALDKDHPGPGRRLSPIMLSTSEGEGLQALAFEAPIEIAANAGNPNRHPIKGVLFQVDEPSPAIPAVGPGLPLFIPRAVAERDVVQAGVSGLPLDAHDSLSQHANEDIAGVMQSAAINGNDCEMVGFVWPWSRKKKVQSILQNANRLGMSINAMAKGHQAEVNGTRVFWVDELRLMGANILYSDKATYRKTRLLAAQGLPEEDLLEREITLLDFPVAAVSTGARDPTDEVEVAIAASAKPNDEYDEREYQPQPEETMSEEIKEQLQAMSRTLSDVVGTLNGTVSQLSNEIDGIKTQLRDVRSDFETRQNIAAQAAEDARKKEEQTSLVQLVRAEMETVLRQINPSGSPARSTHRTVPVAASSGGSGTVSPELIQIQLQIATIDGQLAEAQSATGGHYDSVKIMQLLDRKRDLQMQIGGGY
jgi:hypothetical protein